MSKNKSLMKISMKIKHILAYVRKHQDYPHWISSSLEKIEVTLYSRFGVYGASSDTRELLGQIKEEDQYLRSNLFVIYRDMEEHFFRYDENITQSLRDYLENNFGGEAMAQDNVLVEKVQKIIAKHYTKYHLIPLDSEDQED